MIKKIDSELYSQICKWWEVHGWPVIPIELLTDKGFAAFDGDKPIIAGWIFKDESAKACWFEWIIGNPDSTNEQRESCFKELCEFVSHFAKEIGAVIIFHCTNNKSLIKKLGDNGFSQNPDEGLVILSKAV